ncbi:MAG TPA: SpoVR family protein [Pyrinomonadaceae bacterium]|nr:SpoVR family protein [Pyrinomonadaceae bacterium]
MADDREIKDLERALEQIWEIATRFGLDPFPTRFEIVPATVMYEIGSYALPGRYSHWTFGKAYHRMKTMYDFGLSKIYEVVINTNPSYGFLLETNSPIQNKLVMAHVLGHVDFFKHNVYFSKTNRRMVESVSSHAGRMGEYEFKYGRKTVEEFLDAVLSIEEHIDPNFFIKQERPARDPAEQQRIDSKQKEGRYDDLWRIGEQSTPPASDETAARELPRGVRLPEKDLVYYIMRNSPVLTDWQRDAMAMIHEEMEYFVPQMQTKIMNEGWACATGDSLLLTEAGFLRFDELYAAGEKLRVAGGDANRLYHITDFHREPLVPTLRIRTRRGLTIEGALKHRLMLADGSWAYLSDVKMGERVRVESGNNVWPAEQPALPFLSSVPSATLNTVAAEAGVSEWTILRYLRGRRVIKSAEIEAALCATHYQSGMTGEVLSTRSPFRAPRQLSVELAWLLGFFVGDGNRTKSGICLTCGDEELVGKLSGIIERELGLRARVKWDATATGGRWRVVVHSRELLRWLECCGLDLRAKSPHKKIPTHVLRSPKEIVSAFLRGYFDADAYAGSEGVRLSSSSDELIRTVQLVLLNYGILSTQRPHRDGCTQLEITGTSAALFRREIGFDLTRKQRALGAYVDGHRWFRQQDSSDEVVAIEYGCADVYDITVDTKHAYVANGFVNHNSFWHSRIMRELDLTDTESIEFAELHAGVVSPHKGQLNPYYLGYKILEDIERRWDNPTAEEREKLGRKGGEGREKIFEVRELDNDVSFLRNYLTEELCEELDLFVYELVEEEEWTVTEKRWERVRDQLVSNMTNFGFPYIVVADGDYNRNRELYLKHQFEGAELDANYARKVIEYVFRLWGRPVHLETTADGERIVMRYNGEEHDED